MLSADSSTSSQIRPCAPAPALTPTLINNSTNVLYNADDTFTNSVQSHIINDINFNYYNTIIINANANANANALTIGTISIYGYFENSTLQPIAYEFIPANQFIAADETLMTEVRNIYNNIYNNETSNANILIQSAPAILYYRSYYSLQYNRTRVPLSLPMFTCPMCRNNCYQVLPEESHAICEICYDRTSNCKTECGHTFCRTCIDRWSATYRERHMR